MPGAIPPLLPRWHTRDVDK